MDAPISAGPDAGRPSVLRLMRDVRRGSREAPPDAEARRRERLARLVEFARSRSPHYRRLYRGLPGDVRDIEALPPVTKGELMESFDAWATDPAVTRETAERFVADPSRLGSLYLGRYAAFTTSGTTGRPAILLQDPGALNVYLALLAARRLPTLIAAGSIRAALANRGRTATIITTGGHFASSVVEALVRSRHPRLYGRNRTFSLLEPLPSLVSALNDYRPAIVGSYPTALTVLAGEQSAGRLRIRPALLLSGAERLSPAAAERMAAAFGCPVMDTYAASEFMGIAFDCRLGRLHVNADWVVLEPVDAALRPVPPGTASHTTLLTNLANRVQPLIRYDLGDSVTVLPGGCPCGSPLPGIRPEGRSDEILSLEAPGGGTKPLLPLVLATVVEETEGVGSYQVIRAGPLRLRVRIDEAPGYERLRVCDAVLAGLRRYLDAQGLASATVELADERPRRDTEGGKLRQFFTA